MRHSDNNDDLFTRPPRRTPPPPKRLACAVCGLRSDVLICKECALDTVASIRWLETLPQDDRVAKALDVLRKMG